MNLVFALPAMAWLIAVGGDPIGHWSWWLLGPSALLAHDVAHLLAQRWLPQCTRLLALSAAVTALSAVTMIEPPVSEHVAMGASVLPWLLVIAGFTTVPTRWQGLAQRHITASGAVAVLALVVLQWPGINAVVVLFSVSMLTIGALHWRQARH